MKLKHAVAQVEASELFRAFQKDNPHYYLAHIFHTLGKGEVTQVGYYNPNTDRVVVFDVSSTIKQQPEDEVFKDHPIVSKLDLEQVKIGLEEAIKIADEFHNKKHAAELITQKIIILQNLNGLVYNITHVTRTFNIFNIKIDAVTGEMLSEYTQNITGLQR
ncbi:MAG: PepSY domain-containing protein [Nanoarchaeota archaeon]